MKDANSRIIYGFGGYLKSMLYTILVIIAVIVLAVVVLNFVRSGGRSV